MTGLPGNVCLNCENREPGCHAKCRSYNIAREKRLKEYEARKMISVISDVAYTPKRMTENQRKNSWRRKKR